MPTGPLLWDCKCCLQVRLSKTPTNKQQGRPFWVFHLRHDTQLPPTCDIQSHNHRESQSSLSSLDTRHSHPRAHPRETRPELPMGPYLPHSHLPSATPAIPHPTPTTTTITTFGQQRSGTARLGAPAAPSNINTHHNSPNSPLPTPRKTTRLRSPADHSRRKPLRPRQPDRKSTADNGLLSARLAPPSQAQPMRGPPPPRLKRLCARTGRRPPQARGRARSARFPRARRSRA